MTEKKHVEQHNPHPLPRLVDPLPRLVDPLPSLAESEHMQRVNQIAESEHMQRVNQIAESEHMQRVGVDTAPPAPPVETPAPLTPDHDADRRAIAAAQERAAQAYFHALSDDTPSGETPKRE